MEYIYKIINTETKKFYIGRTKNIEKRLKQHFYMLSKGKHHSIHLQRSYDKYREHNFITEYYLSNDSIREEQIILDMFIKSGLLYNVSGSSSGGGAGIKPPRQRKNNFKKIENTKRRNV